MKILILIISAISAVLCDVSEMFSTTTPQPPPRPYAFGYAAGRFAGNIDRTHSEISDGSGVIQGSYSYIDPSQKIRTVNYIADKNGFHPVLNYNPEPLPRDTDAVAAAKARHHQQYQSIANKHQSGYLALPRDSEAVSKAKHAHYVQYAAIAEAQKVVPGQVVVPLDTIAGQRAASKHFTLYEKIAQDHARIAAEREAEKLQEEAKNVYLY